jgi:hypothetical protein
VGPPTYTRPGPRLAPALAPALARLAPGRCERRGARAPAAQLQPQAEVVVIVVQQVCPEVVGEVGAGGAGRGRGRGRMGAPWGVGAPPPSLRGGTARCARGRQAGRQAGQAGQAGRAGRAGIAAEATAAAIAAAAPPPTRGCACSRRTGTDAAAPPHWQRLQGGWGGWAGAGAGGLWAPAPKAQHTWPAAHLARSTPGADGGPRAQPSSPAHQHRPAAGAAPAPPPKTQHPHRPPARGPPEGR